MGRINEDIWGQESSWLECSSAVLGHNYWDNTGKLANFGNNKYTLIEAINNEKLEFNVPIEDQSLSWCGMGTESNYAHIKIFEGANTVPYEETDVVNFFWYLLDGNQVVGDQDMKMGNDYKASLWSGYDPGQTFGTFNANKFIAPYTQLNLKKIVWLVKVVCRASLRTSSLNTFDYADYVSTYKQTYPIINYIYATPYVETASDPISRSPLTYVAGTHYAFGPAVFNRYMVYSADSYHPDYAIFTGDRTADVPLFGTRNSNDNGKYVIGVGDCKRQNTNPRMTYQDENLDDVLENALKTLACFGFFFILDEDYKNAALDDQNMYMGVVPADGITHGVYTHGTMNRVNPNWDWENSSSSQYDWHGRPPVPTPSGNPMLPTGLQFTLAGRGTGVWSVTPTEIDEIWTDIFGKNVKLEMFGNNPMNAILSLKWTPFDWSQSYTPTTSPIVLGDTIVNIAHEYPIISTIQTAEKHGYGTMRFDFDKNFYNARYMQARLFLPFYGYYELPAAQLLSSDLRLDFYYNVPDDLGVYVISYDNVIYDFVECCCDIEVPLTGSHAAEISASKRAEALSIASQIAVAAVSTVAASGFIAAGARAVSASVANLGAAATESAWAYGGSKLAAGLANIGPLAGDKLIGGGTAIAGAAAGAGLGLKNFYNTIQNGRIERASMRTNLPYHGSALQTTFLHMSMKPYVQIFKNTIMDGLSKDLSGTVKVTLGGTDETQYKLKVGHACDIFATITDMPSNSLLQTTGIGDMDTSNMELSEVQELNSILQSGFYK